MNFVLNKVSYIFLFGLMVLLSGCYDMTVQIVSLPANTPPSDPIYISGNFNNWDPGDPNYVLRPNSDSSLLEVQLPKGVGEIEYKFTRGDWSTVEKDLCGFEVTNRLAIYGRQPVFQDTILTWNDLPKPGCPSFTIILDNLPKNTPDDAALYLAGNFNNWDPGSRYWMFTRGKDSTYYIEVPRTFWGEIYYKVTRGNWHTVECQESGHDIENRVFNGNAGDEVRISIERWKDK
jgi:hypothetical protein